MTTVLDTMYNSMNIAILDASASCHMPDVLEMPYTPKIIGAEKSGEKRIHIGLALLALREMLLEIIALIKGLKRAMNSFLPIWHIIQW